MPLSPDVIYEINSYLLNYNKNKTTGLDIDDKKREINRIQQLINEMAIKENSKEGIKKVTASDWIPIILEIGRTADEAQLKGMYCSKFTETLYMVLHRIRRELPSDLIQAEIAKEKAILATAKTEYISAKNANNKSDIDARALNIDNSIRRLVHLGEVVPLLDLSLDESAALYPGSVKTNIPLLTIRSWWNPSIETQEVKGFEYSETTTIYTVTGVNTYLPLIAQSNKYEDIYLAKYKNALEAKGEIKAASSGPTIPSSSVLASTASPHSAGTASPHSAGTASPHPGTVSPHPSLEFKESKDIATEPASSTPTSETKSPASSILSTKFVLGLQNDLNNYTIGKTHGFDLNLKVTECNNISTLLNTNAKENAATDKWLDLVTYIGEQADRIQNSGTFCSGCTEVFYYILHKMRNELKKNDPQGFAERLAKEKANLEKLQHQARKAKLDNENRSSVLQIELAIIAAKKRLAYFGELDSLLSCKNAQISKLYPGSFNDNPISSMAYFITAASSLGFEYSRTPNIPGSDFLICTVLPLVFDPHYAEIYSYKYREKIRTVADAKEATSNAENTITELEKEIGKLNTTPTVLNIIAHQDLIDEKALSAVEITPQKVQDDIAERIKTIELHIENTQKYIEHAIKTKKDELNAKLTKLTLGLKNVTNAIGKIQATFKKIQLEKERLKEESERIAERNALAAITSLTDKISKLGLDPALKKVVDLEDKDAKTIAEAKVGISDATALSTQATALDADVIRIKEIIAQAHPNKITPITVNQLDPQLARLTQLKNAAQKVTRTLNTFQAQREAEEKVKENIIRLGKDIDALMNLVLAQEADAKALSEAKISESELVAARLAVTKIEEQIAATRTAFTSIDAINKEMIETTLLNPQLSRVTAITQAIEKISQTLKTTAKTASPGIEINMGVEEKEAAEAKENLSPGGTSSVLARLQASSPKSEFVDVGGPSSPPSSPQREFKAGSSSPVGKAARLILYHDVLTALGVAEHNKPKRIRDWEDEFKRDKSVISRLLTKLAAKKAITDTDYAHCVQP